MTEIKICSKCGKELPATTEYFFKMKNGKFGLEARCKKCKAKYQSQNYKKTKEQKKAYNERYYKENKEQVIEQKKRYYEENKEQILELQKQYLEKNKEIISKRGKLYHKINKEKRNEQSRQYYEENKEQQLGYRRQYYEENKEWLIKKGVEYARERKKTDIGFRILNNCRRRLNLAIKGQDKAASTKKLIGCTTEYLLQHLESQFTDGMTWDNYGEWHIDHIKPCALFDFTKEEEQRECFNYINLQPLWAEDNLRKSDKYEEAEAV